MNQSLLSFLLVLLVECISAIVAYLKDVLHQHMRSRDGCCGDAEHEFA